MADPTGQAVDEAYAAGWRDSERYGQNALSADVEAVLDSYTNGEDPEGCEPEDRWRLFRDLREVLSRQRADTPPASPTEAPPPIA